MHADHVSPQISRSRVQGRQTNQKRNSFPNLLTDGVEIEKLGDGLEQLEKSTKPPGFRDNTKGKNNVF